MATNSNLNLTRNDLEKFLPNHRAIRAFESLFQTSTGNTTSIDSLEAGDANSKAQQALDILSDIQKTLDLLSVSPIKQPSELPDYGTY